LTQPGVTLKTLSFVYTVHYWFLCDCYKN